MPNLAPLHPQVVHFVIALAFIGVGARIVSLLPLPKWFVFTGPMAFVLILFSAGASVVAVESGHEAHGPVERVPGSREAVSEHEEAGEWARNMLLVLAGVEILGLALARKQKLATGLKVASALVGLAALAAVYNAGDRGGDLVYNYAGGIGLRSGDTSDVRRLLVAGLYHDAMQQRAAGQGEAAARLIAELERQMPNDMSVKMLGIESILRDRHDPRAALAALDSLQVEANDFRTALRKGMLTADAYMAAGVPDSARMALESLKARFPDNQRMQDMVNRSIERLSGRGESKAEPGEGGERGEPGERH